MLTITGNLNLVKSLPAVLVLLRTLWVNVLCVSHMTPITLTEVFLPSKIHSLLSVVIFHKFSN